MGLLGKLGEMRMKEPVEGTLAVVGITRPDPSATSANYRLDGVVSAPNFDSTAVVHRGVASLSKWPQPGDDLPVTFDRAKPRRLVIHWDRLSTGRERAQSAAQALAEQLRAGSVPPIPVTSPAPSTAAPTDALQPAGPPPIVSAADILARGTPGLAVIQAVFPSADKANKPGHTMVGLQLSVTIAGRQPAEVTNLYAVPDDKLDVVVVGMTLPAKADLATTGLVAIDWQAVTLA